MRRSATRFRDRADAGRHLAEALRPLGLADPLVLALPRGGVPVAVEVAKALDAPTDVFVARKVGAPGQPEFGIGAVAEGGAVVVNEHAVRALHLSHEEFDGLVARELVEVERRVARYRGDRVLPELGRRDVVLVDDGLATGVTAEAALSGLRALGPRRLVLGAPACAASTAHRLQPAADDLVCVLSLRNFSAVGLWYDDFDQVSDAQVRALLGQAVDASAS